MYEIEEMKEKQDMSTDIGRTIRAFLEAVTTHYKKYMNDAFKINPSLTSSPLVLQAAVCYLNPSARPLLPVLGLTPHVHNAKRLIMKLARPMSEIFKPLPVTQPPEPIFDIWNNGANDIDLTLDAVAIEPEKKRFAAMLDREQRKSGPQLLLPEDQKDPFTKELEVYEILPCPDDPTELSTTTKLKSWWVGVKDKLPMLYSAAMKCAVMIPSSASSERVFSTAGRAWRKLRKTMNPHRGEDLVICNRNFDLFKRELKKLK